MATPHFHESARSAVPPHIYRYRAKVLVGPWRKTWARAMADALRARQVRRDEMNRHELRWLVKGRIEECSAP